MPAIIWSKPNCPACVKAKALLQQNAIPFTEKIVGLNCTREELLDEVPGARSVPQIFVDGEHVGDLLALENLLKRNK